MSGRDRDRQRFRDGHTTVATAAEIRIARSNCPGYTLAETSTSTLPLVALEYGHT